MEGTLPAGPEKGPAGFCRAGEKRNFFRARRRKKAAGTDCARRRLLTKCGVQGPSRLLNHAHSLTVARMVSLPRFGSLWAFGPSAHRAHASLRAFGHSKRSRAAGAGEARTHGASGGRGDAPTAAGAGACSGAFAGRCGGAWPGGDSCGVRGDAFLAPQGRSKRSRRLRSPQRRPMPQRAEGGDGTRPQASGYQENKGHSAGGRSRRPNVRTNTKGVPKHHAATDLHQPPGRRKVIK